MNAGRVLLIVASIAMAGAVWGGLCVLGSPMHQRALRLDDQRLSSLGFLSSNVHGYWERHHVLPDDISAMDVAARWKQDPVTGKPYVYEKLDNGSYHLCAMFALAYDGEGTGENRLPRYVPMGTGWQHPAGAHCFRFQAASLDMPNG
ncbi:hypothetical protein [Dyella flagellata]|uniref:Type II secretory pathway, pseudopilin PulG n=1 Tax=Dyella flagellata TaxID=1867833 RepID=A0ABQ5X6H1_9GAMM|nr:hypothetical protein [Dyella flagellata]GLQ86633.1 hypothetical protein GCM10007898_01990 [Dyella flagellata]